LADTGENDNGFDLRVLEEFYARLSAKNGVGIAEFQESLRSYFKRARSAQDLDDYRLSRSAWKKLVDEVMPVSRFLRVQGVESGRVQFLLDNGVPDCWLWKNSVKNPVGLEVTIAQGTERYRLARELVEKKDLSPGFIGLPDDAPRRDFDRAVSRGRVMYSTEQALAAVRRGVLRCLYRKNQQKFDGIDLLIQGPLPPEPAAAPSATQSDIRARVKALANRAKPTNTSMHPGKAAGS
jgi:hypothetical protein